MWCHSKGLRPLTGISPENSSPALFTKGGIPHEQHCDKPAVVCTLGDAGEL